MILLKISGRTFSLLVLAFFLVRPLFVTPIKYHHHQLKDISEYYYERQFDRLFYIDTRRTADDPLVTYYFNGINLQPGDDFVMLRPEEHPDFELNHNNRNSLVLINVHHRNPDYAPIDDEISSKGMLMFENDYYRAYIW